MGSGIHFRDIRKSGLVSRFLSHLPTQAPVLRSVDPRACSLTVPLLQLSCTPSRMAILTRRSCRHSPRPVHQWQWQRRTTIACRVQLHRNYEEPPSRQPRCLPLSEPGSKPLLSRQERPKRLRQRPGKTLLPRLPRPEQMLRQRRGLCRRRKLCARQRRCDRQKLADWQMLTGRRMLKGRQRLCDRQKLEISQMLKGRQRGGGGLLRWHNPLRSYTTRLRSQKRRLCLLHRCAALLQLAPASQ
mmetsp:Transcript_18706/g.56591  ORF Transcript_18706/g.56591 Transcript_18706/m.56591 type:complete len:243 (+) Transcript_18706:2255-2983(+)